MVKQQGQNRSPKAERAASGTERTGVALVQGGRAEAGWRPAHPGPGTDFLPPLGGTLEPRERLT